MFRGILCRVDAHRTAARAIKDTVDAAGGSVVGDTSGAAGPEALPSSPSLSLRNQENTIVVGVPFSAKITCPVNFINSPARLNLLMLVNKPMISRTAGPRPINPNSIPIPVTENIISCIIAPTI